MRGNLIGNEIIYLFILNYTHSKYAANNVFLRNDFKMFSTKIIHKK